MHQPLSSLSLSLLLPTSSSVVREIVKRRVSRNRDARNVEQRAVEFFQRRSLRRIRCAKVRVPRGRAREREREFGGTRAHLSSTFEANREPSLRQLGELRRENICGKSLSLAIGARRRDARRLAFVSVKPSSRGTPPGGEEAFGDILSSYCHTVSSASHK